MPAVFTDWASKRSTHIRTVITNIIHGNPGVIVDCGINRLLRTNFSKL